MNSMPEPDSNINTSTASSSVPAPHVFERIGREMTLLNQKAESLQVEIGKLVTRIPVCDSMDLEGLQALDLLTQTTYDLAYFCNALALLTPESQVLDIEEATRTLKLSDLVNRLTSNTPCLAENPDAKSGDCEIF